MSSDDTYRDAMKTVMVGNVEWKAVGYKAGVSKGAKWVEGERNAGAKVNKPEVSGAST